MLWLIRPLSSHLHHGKKKSLLMSGQRNSVIRERANGTLGEKIILIAISVLGVD